MKKLVDKFLLIFRDPKAITRREQIWTKIFLIIIFLGVNMAWYKMLGIMGVMLKDYLKLGELEQNVLYVVIFLLAVAGSVLMAVSLYVNINCWEKQSGYRTAVKMSWKEIKPLIKINPKKWSFYCEYPLKYEIDKWKSIRIAFNFVDWVKCCYYFKKKQDKEDEIEKTDNYNEKVTSMLQDIQKDINNIKRKNT